MADEAIIEQNKILQGYYDDSAYLSIDNTGAPGLLVRAAVAGREFRITDIIAYNAAVAAAVITLYDQDSNVLTVFALPSTILNFLNDNLSHREGAPDFTG